MTEVRARQHVRGRAGRDVQARLTPVTDVDAREMLGALRIFPLLTGYRGGPRADIEAVEDVIMRVGAMVDRHPEITELDLNPVIVSPDGALVVDWRVRVDNTPMEAPLGAH